MTTSAVDVAAHVRRRLQASQLRLSDHHPFFGALLLMAPVEVTDAFETAATDGERLYFNPAFVEPLNTEQLDGLVVHELLHCALQHMHRRGDRDRLLWNIAADIHVNGVIRGLPHLSLPPGGVEEPALASLSVEEIYDQVRRRPVPTGAKLTLYDLAGDPAGVERGGAGAPAESVAEAAERVRAFWSDAVQRAKAIAEMVAQAKGQGALPAGVDRLVGELNNPAQDWRAVLWRYVVRTPDDFSGFDRRHVWQGLYVDALEGESLDVDVCVDTSGSVDAVLLADFLAEVRGIARSYPSVRCRLYYCDACCVGPFAIDGNEPLPVAKGGGGTSFVPFFEATAQVRDDRLLTPPAPVPAVYLTDGHGTFPSPAPDRPVLWVVAPGGLESSKFPFGTVIRMRTSA